MEQAVEALRNGAVLAELGGYGDGPYCAEYGAGAALVMLGTYIVDERGDVPYPSHFVFRPGPESFAGYLQSHVAAARASGAAVGVSVVSRDPGNDLAFLQAAERAGADFVSPCLHSTMPWFTGEGLSSDLLRRANWPRLRDYLAMLLDGLQRPLIAKIGLGDNPDAAEAVALIVEAGVPVVHANLGDATSEAGRRLASRLGAQVPFLIAGGGIATVEDARAVLAAGAGAVALATAAMDDAGLCGQVQAALRA